MNLNNKIYESDKEQITLKDVQEWIKQQEDSYDCPCCNSKSQIYDRSVDTGLIAFMIAIVKLYRQTGERQIHHATITKYCSTNFNIAPTHYSLLAKFYLINKVNGMCSLTNTGILFLKGLTSVAKKIYISNNEVIRESEEQIFIDEIENMDKYHLKNKLEINGE